MFPSSQNLETLNLFFPPDSLRRLVTPDVLGRIKYTSDKRVRTLQVEQLLHAWTLLWDNTLIHLLMRAEVHKELL